MKTQAIRKPSAHRIATELRRLQIGDRWEYDAVGTATREGQLLQLAGTITVTVEERDVGGRRWPSLVFAEDRRVAGVDGPEGAFPLPAGVFYFEQDAVTFDVRIAGDNMHFGGDRFAQTPRVFYPGRWSTGTFYSHRLDFGAAGIVDHSLDTTGVEVVETPLGAFHAWRAPVAADSSEIGLIEGVDYWTPQLGAPVRFERVAGGPDGSALATVACLRSTNVPVF